MSVFVDQSTFPVHVRFKPITSESGQVTGVRVVPAAFDEPGTTEIVCACAGRDFDTMSRILEEATVINHVSGAPMVRTRALCRGIIHSFVKGWNVVDESTGQPAPLNVETVSGMHDSLARAIARAWLDATGGRRT
jgi:hypothetical protein